MTKQITVHIRNALDQGYIFVYFRIYVDSQIVVATKGPAGCTTADTFSYDSTYHSMGYGLDQRLASDLRPFGQIKDLRFFSLARANQQTW